MSIDFTKPVQNRIGQPVTILTTTRRHPLYPVVGMVEDKDLVLYTDEGRCFADGREHDLDLMNVPVKHTREVWVNMYPEKTDLVGHKTRRIADDFASSDRIACIPITIEFEEGEGL